MSTDIKNKKDKELEPDLFTSEQLVAAAPIRFDVAPEVMRAALARKNQWTIGEAVEALHSFMKAPATEEGVN